MHTHFDPETDLEIDRVLMAPPSSIWRCWTEPELLKQWYCPKPAIAEEVRLAPTPGGEFFTRLRLPNGRALESRGCVLAAMPQKLLVFTDALTAGFHPSKTHMLTTVIFLTPEVVGTRYVARALLDSPERRAESKKSGFFDGWGRSIDQLQELAGSLDRR